MTWSSEAVIRAILRYLVEHPDAKDACDGVSRWWLPGDLVNRQGSGVQEALDFLVSRGWLTARKTRSSKKIYGLNKERLEEVEEFMRGSGGGK